MDTLLKQVLKQTYQKVDLSKVTFPCLNQLLNLHYYLQTFNVFLIVIYAFIQLVRYKLRKIFKNTLIT